MHFKRIKCLRVELESAWYTSALGSWTIDFSTEQCDIDFGQQGKEHMQQAVDAVMARGGTGALGPRDLDFLRLAVQDDYSGR